MVDIRIDTIGAERLARRFNRYADLVKDWTPAFLEIEENLLKWNKKNFEVEGRPQPFKELSPDYAEWKLKTFGPLPILVLTGKLKAALTQKKQGYLHEVEKMSATFGVDRKELPYAVYQYIQKRKAVQLTEEMKNKGYEGLQGMVQILQRYAYEYWKASGIAP